MTSPATEVFWELPKRHGSISGDEVQCLLRRSLEANAFSATGLDLRKANSAEKLLRMDIHAEEARNMLGAKPSALSFAEDELAERKKEVMRRVEDLVHDMGLSSAPNAAIAEPQSPIASANLDVPDDLSASTSKPPGQAESEPALKATAASPIPLRHPPSTTHAPKSALAMLVASAKARQQDVGDTGAQANAAPSAPVDRVTKVTDTVLKRPRTTNEIRSRIDHEQSDSDDDSFAVQLPPGAGRGGTDPRTALPLQGGETVTAREGDALTAAKHPSQMTREEFLSQYKRAPRRGEVGQSAEEIAKAQQLGYVMSGSRSIGAQMYVDRIQRQLHEREAGKLQQQFRKVEDERMDEQMVEGMLRVLKEKAHAPTKPQ